VGPHQAETGKLIAVGDDTTVHDLLRQVRDVYHDRPLIAVPARADRDYLPQGIEISYRQAVDQAESLARQYADAGVGHGHRIAVLMENRPDLLIHKFALNILGASCVPVNPDYRNTEIAYLVDHSEADGAVCLERRLEQMHAGVSASGRALDIVALEQFGRGAPRPRRRAPLSGPVGPGTEASIQYTSGTTGRPKGCVMSQNYELACGAWYATRGGLAALGEGERLYTTLPLYHCNSLFYSFNRMLVTGGCQIQSDRFSPARWWDEIRQTRANIFHYLGVLISLLMERTPQASDRDHEVRFAIGAGVEPDLHAKFEERFGIPLVEQWGMTEITRCLGDYHPPRKVGTRSFGKAVPTLQARVVDETDQDVPDGREGELIVRHSEQTPRKLCFSGYLKDPEATEAAWRGGWFRTGDVVMRDADGFIHFVERKKNIIRRSGENIAPAEVENVLMTHPDVRQVAIIPVPDETREEEVMACVALKDGPGDEAAARSIVGFCLENLAYYKAPAWVCFLDELPVTGTLKVQKHQLFPALKDKREAPGIFDLRDMKRRTS